MLNENETIIAQIEVKHIAVGDDGFSSKKVKLSKIEDWLNILSELDATHIYLGGDCDGNVTITAYKEEINGK